MTALRQALARIRALFRPAELDAQLDEEVRTHLALLAEEYMRRGMTPEEARSAALREFGGVAQAKESYREQRGLPVFETFWQDCRYGVRTLWASRTFTLAAILTLALGTGGTVAVFSLVNGVLLHQLPYPDAGRLVALTEYSQQAGEMSASWQNFLDWRERAKTFSGMAAIQPVSLALTGRGRAERIAALNVSASFLSVLGIAPAIGRDFSARDDRVGAVPVVILSHALWRRRFNADPSVLGRSIVLDGNVTVIAGVLPERFRFYLDADLFEPIGQFAKDMGTRGNHPGLQVIGRMRAGVPIEQVRAEIETIAAQLRAEYPQYNAASYVRVEDLGTRLTGGVRKTLLLLLGAVGCVLLIACANVSNLLLARATARKRELELRTALGAGRARIMRQLLTENLLLAAAGTALGLAFAYCGLRVWTGLVPEEIGRVATVGIGGTAFAAACVLALLTAIGFGLAPAWSLTRGTDLITLKSGVRTAGTSFRGHSLQNILAGVQIAIALVLLAGAGLLVRSLVKIYQVDPGFRADRLMTMRFIATHATYPEATQRTQVVDRILERVEQVPGVASASSAFCLPLNGGCWGSVLLVAGRPTPPRASMPIVLVNEVHPGYFRTLGVPLLRGRDFDARDTAKTMPVAVISESFAKKFFPKEDPLGRQVKLDYPEGELPYLTIVGIVGDVRRYGLTEEVEPEVFQSARQNGPTIVNLILRTKVGDPLRLAGAVQSEIGKVDPEIPVDQVRSIDYYLAQSAASRRFPLALLGVFAGLALTLAGVGLYGVTSYLVSLRTQEMGIRLAMGATPGDVVALILRHGAKVTATGCAAGLAGAFALTSLLEKLLYGVERTDAMTLAATIVILAATALTACWIPARRAARIDPMAALRNE